MNSWPGGSNPEFSHYPAGGDLLYPLSCLGWDPTGHEIPGD